MLKGVVVPHITLYNKSFGTLRCKLKEAHFHFFRLIQRSIGKCDGINAILVYRYGFTDGRNLILLFKTYKSVLTYAALQKLCILMIFEHPEDIVGWCQKHLCSFCEDHRL